MFSALLASILFGCGNDTSFELADKTTGVSDDGKVLVGFDKNLPGGSTVVAMRDGGSFPVFSVMRGELGPYFFARNQVIMRPIDQDDLDRFLEETHGRILNRTDRADGQPLVVLIQVAPPKMSIDHVANFISHRRSLLYAKERERHLFNHMEGIYLLGLVLSEGFNDRLLELNAIDFNQHYAVQRYEEVTAESDGSSEQARHGNIPH